MAKIMEASRRAKGDVSLCSHYWFRSGAGVACLLAAMTAMSDESYPKPGWTNAPHPLACAQAVSGGEFAVYAGASPKSLNYYLDNNSFSAAFFGLLYETLLTRHALTLEDEPNLAERWAISDDRKTFTFWITPRARWSDGQPVTAEDVRWTFQTLVDPRHLTGPHKVALETFQPPEVLSPLCIRFRAREVHWRNLMAIGDMPVLPAHAMTNLDFNKINFDFPVVSGPYSLSEVKENRHVLIERRANWWQRGLLSTRGIANFQRVRFRFFAEAENAFESFRKGELDLFPVYMARLWVKETVGDRFDRNWIVKQRVHNFNPVGFQGFAMNLRRAPFDDRRVRQALALLLNRTRMNATLMYNQYFLHRSYYEDLYDDRHPCANVPAGFDPAAALRLLAEAGWKVNPATGLLEKQGQPFVLRFQANGGMADKFLAIYGEDLRNAGIELKVEHKDWAAWTKDMDSFAFDMTWASWGSGLLKDPEGMWSSKEADRTGSSNITGFKDPRVDALIEQQKTIFDVNRRHAIVREIDKLLVEQAPYILLWNINYRRLLYWNKFGTPGTVLTRYGDEGDACLFWWADADSTAELKDAQLNSQPLPVRPAEIRFDEIFKP